jgi:hypothetical protein
MRCPLRHAARVTYVNVCLVTLSLSPKQQQQLKQGDQIGRIFAKRVVVYFGQLLENYKGTPIIYLLHSMVKFIHES